MSTKQKQIQLVYEATALRNACVKSGRVSGNLIYFGRTREIILERVHPSLVPSWLTFCRSSSEVRDFLQDEYPQTEPRAYAHRKARVWKDFWPLIDNVEEREVGHYLGQEPIGANVESQELFEETVRRMRSSINDPRWSLVVSRHVAVGLATYMLSEYHFPWQAFESTEAAFANLAHLNKCKNFYFSPNKEMKHVVMANALYVATTCDRFSEQEGDRRKSVPSADDAVHVHEATAMLCRTLLYWWRRDHELAPEMTEKEYRQSLLRRAALAAAYESESAEVPLP